MDSDVYLRVLFAEEGDMTKAVVFEGSFPLDTALHMHKIVTHLNTNNITVAKIEEKVQSWQPYQPEPQPEQ